jgi:hypothetical protein
MKITKTVVMNVTVPSGEGEHLKEFHRTFHRAFVKGFGEMLPTLETDTACRLAGAYVQEAYPDEENTP